MIVGKPEQLRSEQVTSPDCAKLILMASFTTSRTTRSRASIKPELLMETLLFTLMLLHATEPAPKLREEPVMAPADVIPATPPNDSVLRTASPAALMVAAPCPMLTAPSEAMVVLSPPTFKLVQLAAVVLRVRALSDPAETAPA